MSCKQTLRCSKNDFYCYNQYDFISRISLTPKHVICNSLLMHFINASFLNKQFSIINVNVEAKKNTYIFLNGIQLNVEFRNKKYSVYQICILKTRKCHTNKNEKNVSNSHDYIWIRWCAGVYEYSIWLYISLVINNPNNSHWKFLIVFLS